MVVERGGGGRAEMEGKGNVHVRVASDSCQRPCFLQQRHIVQECLDPARFDVSKGFGAGLGGQEATERCPGGNRQIFQKKKGTAFPSSPTKPTNITPT